ncbi:MAG: imidazole glycerol phosphate synthase subunit HisH [Anaerolineales bacterium]
MQAITLVDAGTGNLRSVQKAFEWLGVSVMRTDKAEEISRARTIVLPGVGAFGDFMQGLKAKALDEAILYAIGQGAYLLGICVGMQALFDVGYELGVHAGLGLLKGSVNRFPMQNNLKIPHTGWNEISCIKNSPLFYDINLPAYVYFNHAYYCQAEDKSDVIASCHYGIDFTCAVQHDRVFGVQFHPEKSQQDGLRILKNFAEASDD